MSAEQKDWRRAVRDQPLLVSYEVWAALRLVVKCKGSIEPGVPRMTEAQLADEILLLALKEEYPEIFEHRRVVEKLEKELIRKVNHEDTNP
jgi:hypothetical protein